MKSKQLRWLRCEDHKFKSSLGNLARSYLQNGERAYTVVQWWHLSRMGEALGSNPSLMASKRSHPVLAPRLKLQTQEVLRVAVLNQESRETTQSQNIQKLGFLTSGHFPLKVS